MTSPEKELLQEQFRGVYSMIQANSDVQNEVNKNIIATLDRIEEQTKKTNGAVAQAHKEIEVMKLNNIKHSLNCAVSPRVDKLEKKLIYYAGGMAVFVFFISVIISMFF